MVQSFLLEARDEIDAAIGGKSVKLRIEAREQFMSKLKEAIDMAMSRFDQILAPSAGRQKNPYMWLLMGAKFSIHLLNTLTIFPLLGCQGHRQTCLWCDLLSAKQ